MLKTISKLSLILMFFTVLLQADFTQDQKIATSIDILKSSKIHIPAKILKNAKAIAVIPNLKNGGLFINGSYGTGVLSIKESDGNWSDPSFISFRNLSFGLQAGIKSTDAIIVFESRRSLDGIADEKVTLSFNIGGTILQNGQDMSRKTDAKLSANIYMYGESSGLFLNFMSISNGIMYINDDMNDAYYGELIDTNSLLDGYLQSKKREVLEFQKVLSDLTK